jgi:hypothetical protein
MLLACALFVGAGCGPSPGSGVRVPDAATAERVARDFYATAHGTGATVDEVTVGSIGEALVGGRDTWQVEIHGTVKEPGMTTGYLSAMILRIDAETSQVTIYAQG